MRLNRAPVGDWVDLPAEIREVLDCALDVQRLSAGAFDPCVGALVDAWGFGAVRDAPDAQAIRAARQSTPLAAHGGLEMDSPAGRARKHVPLQLDLCGIAKGYAVDRMAHVLQQHGVRHALAALDGAGCTPEEAEAIYRLTSLCTFEDRFVIPPAHREEAIQMLHDPLQHKQGVGFGFLSGPRRGM